MTYSTFTGKDGSQANFPWVTQKIAGVDAMVFVLDVAGLPVSSSNPVPISVGASPGTMPVSIAATVATDQVVLGAALSSGTVATLTTTQTLKTATSGRKVIYVSNGGTVGVWLSFGATAAVVGAGLYLPPGSNEPFPYAGEIRVVSASGAAGPIGYVEF